MSDPTAKTQQDPDFEDADFYDDALWQGMPLRQKNSEELMMDYIKNVRRPFVSQDPSRRAELKARKAKLKEERDAKMPKPHEMPLQPQKPEPPRRPAASAAMASAAPNFARAPVGSSCSSSLGAGPVAAEKRMSKRKEDAKKPQGAPIMFSGEEDVEDAEGGAELA